LDLHVIWRRKTHADKDFTTQLIGCSCLFSFYIICSHVFLNVREGSFISWKPTNGLQ
jgi:hypothetical protein